MAKKTSFLKRSLVLLFKFVWQILLPVRRILAVVFWPLRPITRPIARYLVGVGSEFRKVSWPSRRETLKLTVAVAIFSLIFATFVAVVDYGLGILFEKVIVKG